jgi:hypothetical protein
MNLHSETFKPFNLYIQNLIFLDTFSKNPQISNIVKNLCIAGAYPGILLGGGSTNSDEDRGQRERGSGDDSPLLSGSAQFADE